jgi:hypothetical protein
VEKVDHPLFFEVAAQVIPILFIALLLQMRYFESPDQQSPSVNLFVLSLVVFAGIGEIIALGAVFGGHHTTVIEQGAVMGAITVLFLPMLVRAGRPFVHTIAGSSRLHRGILQAAVGVFAAGIGAATIFNSDIFAPFLGAFAIGFYIVACFAGTFIDRPPKD